ncbi:putative lipase atg15 [Pleurotus pulmonarius]|nr:putative lipase atg15 [Pleurotus pulmonarius]KAF4608593.1 putative lipase atg15 [Pleurotus pulmonarius]
MLPALFLSLLILTSAADARHVHFNIQHPLLLDQHPTPTPISQSLLARPTTVYRPRDPAALDRARIRSLRYGQSEPLEWYEKEVLAPDIEDRHTIEQLARMAGNAYALPGQKNWYDVDTAWNTSFPFGWEDHANGFRGNVFLSSDNSTVVLSIKGTTIQGPTSKKDKFNDNLLFSCCCARVDFSWVFRTVCDCYANHWKCDDTCLSDALIQDSLFYTTGVKLVMDLTFLYPSANIWLVGHSLGGSLASLLGATFGLPAIAFEAPGERLAAQRLHLPLPPPVTSPNSTSTPSPTASLLPNIPRRRIPSTAPLPVTHIYHTADPIPQGTCTGPLSPCAQGGYALETRCHLGKSIVYDTVGVLGWRVDIRKHVIREVVEKVLGWEDGWPDEEDAGGEDEMAFSIGTSKINGVFRWVRKFWWGWGGKKNKGSDDGERPPPRLRDVPRAKEEVDCTDCFKWEFGDFKDVPPSEELITKTIIDI